MRSRLRFVSMYKAPAELAIRNHQLTNLLGLLTAGLPLRESGCYALHDYTVTEGSKRITPLQLAGGVPTGDLTVPSNALLSGR